MALALTLLPLVVSAIAVVATGSKYFPVADQAVEELHTRDIGHHAVLIGLWSRQDWSHPGPALFYLLAVPYRLTGGSPRGLVIGALLINGAALAGMAMIAWRRGGLPLLLLTCLGCSVLVRALGASFVRDFWVPDIPVLPFCLLLFLIWSMAGGEVWALPAAVAVASFVVQTHIGYLPLAPPLVVGGALLLVRDARRAGDGAGDASAAWRQLSRAGLIALAVAVVMWLPPIIDELAHHPGNLSSIYRYFRSGGPLPSARDSYRVVAAQFVLVPDWLTGRRHRSPFTGGSELTLSTPLPVLLLPFAAAAVLLWRRRAWDALRLMAVLAATAILGIISVMRTIGTVYVYRLFWSWVVAMMAGVATAWAAWLELLRRGHDRAANGLAWVVVVLVFALAAINSVSAAQAGTPQKADSANEVILVRRVAASLPPGEGDVVLRTSDPISRWYAWGLLVALAHRDINAVLPGAGDAYVVGAAHVQHGGPVRQIVTIAADTQVDALGGRSDLRMVAYAGTLSPARRTDVVRRLAALRERHDAGRLSGGEWIAQSGPLAAKLGSAVAAFVPRR